VSIMRQRVFESCSSGDDFQSAMAATPAAIRAEFEFSAKHYWEEIDINAQYRGDHPLSIALRTLRLRSVRATHAAESIMLASPKTLSWHSVERSAEETR